MIETESGLRSFGMKDGKYVSRSTPFYQMACTSTRPFYNENKVSLLKPSCFETGTLLAESATMVQGRSNRVCDAVLRDLTNYQEDVYTERVKDGINVLRSTLMPQFEAQVASTVRKIG